jgi:hypothetical protein
MTFSPQLRIIPVWIRVLALVVVAAAALAIILVIRGVPGQALDGPGFVRLAAQAILYFCMIVLFGYVVATGLPPTHWWRSAGQDLRPAEPDLALTPDLHRYLALLRERHPQIRECWFLDAARPGEHRLLAIAGVAALDGVRGDWDIRRKDVRLYLLEENVRTVALAWGRSSPVPFGVWDWEPQADALAEFRCPVSGQTRLAQRLWCL